MAKFCGNCGTAQPDNARVCGNCGTPFAAPMQNPGARPAPRPVANNNVDPAKKANLMKWGKLAAMALAAIVVIGLLIGIISGAGNPKSAAKKYINALNKGNERKVAAMMTDLATKDASKDVAEELVEDWEDEFEDCKITKIEIEDVEKVDKDEVKEMREGLKDTFKEIKDAIKDDEIDKDDVEDMGINLKYNWRKIKGCAEVTVEITYKDEDGDKQKEEIMVYLIKEGGSWKILEESLLYGMMGIY
jgi:hypothetical protein